MIAVAQDDRSDGDRDRNRSREGREREHDDGAARADAGRAGGALAGGGARRVAGLRLRGRGHCDLGQDRSPCSAGWRELERLVLAQHRLLEGPQLLAWAPARARRRGTSRVSR